MRAHSTAPCQFRIRTQELCPLSMAPGRLYSVSQRERQSYDESPHAKKRGRQGLEGGTGFVPALHGSPQALSFRSTGTSPGLDATRSLLSSYQSLPHLHPPRRASIRARALHPMPSPVFGCHGEERACAIPPGPRMKLKRPFLSWTLNLTPATPLTTIRHLSACA